MDATTSWLQVQIGSELQNKQSSYTYTPRGIIYPVVSKPFGVNRVPSGGVIAYSPEDPKQAAAVVLQARGWTDEETERLLYSFAYREGDKTIVLRSTNSNQII